MSKKHKNYNDMENDEVILDEVPEVAEEEVEVPEEPGDVYTYVGKGDEPPRKINFMGLQEFVRGVATKVTNPTVLHKIANHPCFRKGAATMSELHDQDEIAARKAEEQRLKDKALNAAYAKKHRTE